MTTTSLNQYFPDEVSPPRSTLQELLEEREISIQALAEQTGLPVKKIELFLSDEADAPLTPEFAQGLTKAFGLSAGFWLRRERDYRDSLTRQARDTARKTA